MQATDFLELGVLRGAFAEHVLRQCPGIARYYMLDPWRHLDDWNKPANVAQAAFDDIKAEAMARTQFADERRIVLRGKTVEVIDEISDRTLDIAYVDGDHTLRGPVLFAFLVFDVEQNAEAACAGCRAIEFGAVGVWECVAHDAACGTGSIAEKPCVFCAGRSLGGEGDLLAWVDERRVDSECGKCICGGSELRLLRTSAD